MEAWVVVLAAVSVLAPPKVNVSLGLAGVLPKPKLGAAAAVVVAAGAPAEATKGKAAVAELEVAGAAGTFVVGWAPNWKLGAAVGC